MTNNRLEEIRARWQRADKPKMLFTGHVQGDVDYILSLLDARPAVAADARELVLRIFRLRATTELGGQYRQLVEAITAYGNQRYREGVIQAAKIARDRADYRGVFNDVASDTASQATATVIASDISNLLNQPPEKSLPGE